MQPCEEDSEVTETTSSSETVDSEGESGTAGGGAGDGSGTTTETDRRGRRNRIRWNGTRRTPDMSTLPGHVTRLLEVPAQTRERTRPRQTARLTTNGTSNRLTRVPSTTNKTKDVDG